MRRFSKRRVLVIASLLVVVASSTIFPDTASAQAGTVISGIVVGVDTDADGRLIRFAVSDSSGTVTTFEVSDATEYGLENQAGDRWVSTQGEEPVEVVHRLSDHRERFATVIVSSENGVATSVVEREEGKLETSLGYLFAVFLVTWALFFAYVLYMG
ncbi:MAG: hypothetical protein O6922_02225, partial [Chloroflexi bacterium]|nr:hypothetical protein [Chloroflexota bacterium]